MSEVEIIRQWVFLDFACGVIILSCHCHWVVIASKSTFTLNARTCRDQVSMSSHLDLTHLGSLIGYNTIQLILRTKILAKVLEDTLEFLVLLVLNFKHVGQLLKGRVSYLSLGMKTIWLSWENG